MWYFLESIILSWLGWLSHSNLCHTGIPYLKAIFFHKIKKKNYFRWIENNNQLRYMLKLSSILIPSKCGVWHVCNVANFARKWPLLSTLLFMATQAILRFLMTFSWLRHQNEADHAIFFKIWDIRWIAVSMILRWTGT